ncbi:carbonic anhydrase family protein [Prosthecobacter vanneervenii]|uniref:Carbonic anhydrase n=1 Tax=Prosthecobacter vanneervenii TaxID=48466 RepID=A0A7W7YFZ7_9BACT|nr:carbonic anhydrase family protein [Prosthecobacter vanneervenii]MBB5035444.1 carbonic anhydrase [Prosthecobacter vanneervenii]
MKRVSIICAPAVEEHVTALLEEIGAEGQMIVPVRGIDGQNTDDDGEPAETAKLQIEVTLDPDRAEKLLQRIQSDLIAASSAIAAYESDIPEEDPAESHVTTAEEQARLTPDEVLQQFKDGNRRFRSGHITRRNHPEQVRKSAVGQFPKAVVLSCLDSRVPVEDVFDQGIGDVFVARVAGNLVNEDILGSMEFACKAAGAKMILVMGHQHCGAIRGAIDDVQMGNLTSLLAKIKPAVVMSKDFPGEQISSNPLYMRHVARNNVRYALSQIRTRSPILKEMEEKGEIKIVGAFYRLTDGTLEFIE